MSHNIQINNVSNNTNISSGDMYLNQNISHGKKVENIIDQSQSNNTPSPEPKESKPLTILGKIIDIILKIFK